VLQCVTVCCSVLQSVAVIKHGTAATVFQWLRLHKSIQQSEFVNGMYCSVLHYVAECVAVCCSVLQRVAVCCSVLQCVAVCCSVLQRVAVCCSVLQCVAYMAVRAQEISWIYRVCVCCSVLQCVAVCRSVLQLGGITEKVLLFLGCLTYFGRVLSQKSPTLE